MSQATDRLSPRKTRRPAQSRARQRQERLLDAAEKLVADQGFETVRIQDIASAADCAVGSAYYLFGSKEGLIDALRDRYLAQTRAEIERAFKAEDSKGQSLSHLVDRLVHNAVAQIAAHQGLFRASLLRAATQPEAWEGFRGLVRLLRDQLAPQLEREFGIPRRHVEFSVQVIFSTCANTILNEPGPLRLEDPAFADELAAMVRAYLSTARAH